MVSESTYRLRLISASRRSRLAAFFVTFLVGAYCLLRFATSILLAEVAVPGADFVFLGDNCGQCYRAAADQAIAGKIDGVLLFAEEPKRVNLLGVIPTSEQRLRQKFVEDGVDGETIQIIPGVSSNDWETVRLLKAWLEDHPDKRVCFVCDRFAGGRWSFILDRMLDQTKQSRVTVDGITDPRYDETNWWRKRTGLKSFFDKLLQLVYARLHGEDFLPAIDWSAEKYESLIMKQMVPQ